MKYLHFILKNIVPEWIKLYLNYKLLKTYLVISTKLKELLVLAKKTKTQDQYKYIKALIAKSFVLMDKLEYDKKCFVEHFEEETKKVEAFANWKQNDLRIKMGKLKEQVKAMKSIKEDLEIRINQLKLQQKRIKTRNYVLSHEKKIDKNRINKDLKDLKTNKAQLLETMYRFYNETLYFQSYVEINNEAIRKILKKYKKQMIKGIRNKKEEKEFFGKIVEKLSMQKVMNKIKTLLLDIEQLMVKNFYSTRPNQCRENLEKYTEKENVQKNTLFCFGFFCGCALLFIGLLIILGYEGFLTQKSEFVRVFPIFRGMGLLLLYNWFLALDVQGWNYFRINYKIYLGFNHHFSTLPEIISRLMIFSGIYIASIVMFCLQIQPYSFVLTMEFMNPVWLPLISWIAGVGYLFFPSKRYLNGEGRLWILKMTAKSVCGYLIKYESRFTFFTSQFVSLIVPMMDLNYTVCFYYKELRNEDSWECSAENRVSTLAICVVPYILICCHHLAKAKEKGKFWMTDEMWSFLKNLVTMQLGVISYLALSYSSLVWVWLAFAVISCVYQYFWDIRRDWLFSEPETRYKFLRNDLGYNNRFITNLIMTLNVFLRVFWVFNISPFIYAVLGVPYSYLVIFGVSILELVRRSISNFLKIEKAHITNLKLLKTVQDYRYPFNTGNQLREKEEQEYDDEQDNRITHWSISTMNRPINEDSKEVEALECEVEESRYSVGNKDGILSLSMKRSDEASMQVPKRSELYSQQAYWDILKKANSLEVFQVSKVKELQTDNEKYKELIEELFDKFQLSQK